MEARDRAVWEDAEGSLRVPSEYQWRTRNTSPSLRTSQLELGILQDYYVGALRDGVKCSLFVRNAKKTVKTPRAFTFYETSVIGLANIALELRLTAPYRRSVKMANQILKFKSFIALPRKQIRGSIMEARNLSHYF
jgi:hypothetical protein